MLIKKIKNHLRSLKDYPIAENWFLKTRHQLENLIKESETQRSADSIFLLNKSKIMTLLQAKFVAPALAGIIILVLGGTAIASQNSLPNDNLYPVKIAIEKVELAIASLDGQNKKAEIKLKHTLKRLEEVQALIEEHQENGLVEEEEESEEIEAIENLEEQTEDALEETDKTLEEENGEETLNKKELLVQKLQRLTERHQEVLQKVYDKAPEQAKPALERVMEKSQRGHQRAIEAVQKDQGKHKGWYKDGEVECETSITCEEGQIASTSGEIDEESCEIMFCIDETASESTE